MTTDRSTRPRSLSKSMRGLLALVTAALLLLSGYGSYALWTSSVSLDGGRVDSGRLDLTDATAGVWRDSSAADPGTVIADIGTYLVVPGDRLTFSASATVRAQGDNLQATLAADPASVTGDAALLADMTISTSVTVDGVPTTAITEADDGHVVAAVVTFDFDDDSGNDTQQENLDLSALELTLSQNPR